MQRGGYCWVKGAVDQYSQVEAGAGQAGLGTRAYRHEDDRTRMRSTIEYEYVLSLAPVVWDDTTSASRNRNAANTRMGTKGNTKKSTNLKAL